MQDRYLFRGKRIDNREWIYGFLSKRRLQGYKENTLQPCIDHEEKGLMLSSVVDPTTVGQCTGLKDKNGKLIFEGDIMRDTGELASDNPGIIEWSNAKDNYSYQCGFRVDWQEPISRRSDLSFWVYQRNIEVAGNIHDKSEVE